MIEAQDGKQTSLIRRKESLFECLNNSDKAWNTLEIAIRTAAVDGGIAAMSFYRHARSFSEGYDAATEADHASTRAIIRTLEPDLNRLSREFVFGYSYFGEELEKYSKGTLDERESIEELLSQISEARRNVRQEYEDFIDYFDKSRLCVLFDPLDGTNAFRSEIPVFTTGVSFIFDGRPLLGAIYDPIQNAVYYGSLRSEKPSAKAWYVSTGDLVDLTAVRQRTLSGRGDLKHIAFQATGDQRMREEARKVYNKLSNNFRDIMVPNAGHFSMAGVARGSFDGYVNNWTYAWDIAPGEVIVKAIGGKVTNFDGSDIDYRDRRVGVIAVAPAEMHKSIFDICVSTGNYPTS